MAKKIVSPFRQSGTVSNRAFSMALKGTTLLKLKRLADNEGASYPRIIRMLRKESAHGFTWQYEEKDGSVRVNNVKAKRLHAAGSTEASRQNTGTSSGRRKVNSESNIQSSKSSKVDS